MNKELYIQLKEIQEKIEQARKIVDQRKAAGEIRRLQQMAGRIALNYINSQEQKEI